MKKPKHLLSLQDFTEEELEDLLIFAAQLKTERSNINANKLLAGKTIAMIFSKASTRTRVSFQAGIYESGGNSLFLDHNDLQLGRGESMSDTARVLNRYIHAVVIRTYRHESLVEYAQHSTIPVINALTDKFHPCQLLADLLTIKENSNRLGGVKVAYLGDGTSNMAYSWAIAAKLSGIDLRIGAPLKFQPDNSFTESLSGKGDVIVTDDPQSAVRDADYIYTDVWVSMGFESEAEERLKLLTPYQVNDQLVKSASSDVKIMHCLPAKRGQEITAEVLDGPHSIIWDEAENRLHAQKAVLAKLVSS